MIITTLATQRSGTKAFGSLFSTGTEIATFGEIFNPDLIGAMSFRSYIASERYADLLRLGSEGVIDAFLGSFLLHRSKIHFDVMFNQLDYTCISWNRFYRRFMYGYLRSRRALVILMTRSTEDSFKSVLHLDKTGRAHIAAYEELRLAPSSDEEVVRASRLDFQAYHDAIMASYDEVRRNFSDYPFFCEVSYEEFAALQAIPDRLVSAIVACATENGIPCDSSRIQMGRPVYGRAGSVRLILD